MVINRIFKKYIFIIVLMYLSLLICCAESFKPYEVNESSGVRKINNVIYPDLDKSSISNNIDIDSKLEKIFNEFAYKNAVDLFLTKDNANKVFSPVSLYLALSMLGEGATEAGLNELKEYMGFNTLDELRESMNVIYQENYYENNLGTSIITNSLWVKEGLSIEEDYLNVLREYYYGEVYSSNFDNKAIDEIVNYLNHNTNNFLKVKKEDIGIDNDTLMMLINTIYFDNQWKYKFEDISSMEFYAYEETISCDFIAHTITSKVYENEKYTMVTDYFENDNTISYYLPNQGNSVYELFKENIFDTNNLSQNNGLFSDRNVKILVPKFEYKKSYNLNDVLKNRGVKSIFESGNFKSITNIDTFVSIIKQDVGISLSENGVKASAITQIGLNKATANQEYIFILDRPFAYVIRDKNNVPLFIGIVNNPNIKNV